MQKNWIFETEVVLSVARLLEMIPTPFSSPSLGDSLEKEQKQAILQAFSSSLSLITGGPGTGKSFTAASLATHFIQAGARVVLAAPTGKAASKLQELSSIPAFTLHFLLNFPSEERKPLPYDLILVDEASMIDARLFAALLSSIKEGTRLVLMGDPHQLPSVDAGSFFADLVEVAKKGAIAHTHLGKIFRLESLALIDFAASVKEAKEEMVFSHLESSSCIKRVSFQKEEDLFSHVSAFFPLPCKEFVEEELFDKLSKFVILSSMREGPFGVHAINYALVQKMKEQVQEGERLILPILIQKNDEKLQLYNGERGFLISGKEEYALFKTKEGFRKIPRFALPRFEYGYALSIHKSQGSEYDRVLLFLPKGSERFGREVLYTAVTRVKKEIEVSLCDETLTLLLRHKEKRRSSLCERLG